MLKIALIAIAVALTGCATTRQERAAAFQQEAPQLVASCNKAFSDAGPRTRDGINACGRLATKDSLGLVEPATANAYTSYANSRRGSGMSNAGSVRNSPTPIPGPGGSTQSIQ
jgi:hypothetical protein